MDTLQDLFEHNRQLRIIVCKSCSIAIPPRHIAAHLRAHHPKTPVEVRLKIAEATHTHGSRMLFASQRQRPSVLRRYLVVVMPIPVRFPLAGIPARRYG
jgi:hypothetical protein